MKKISPLNELVRKFSKRHALFRLRPYSFLNRVFRHHIINCNMLPYISDKTEERVFFHPVIIIYHYCPVFFIWLEIEKFRKLLLNSFLIFSQGCFIEQVPLFRFSWWVSNHPCCSAYKSYRCMSAPLKMHEQHNLHHMTYMQWICSRIESDISACSFLF